MIVLKSLDEMTPREVHALYKLRVDVFVGEQQCPYNEIDDQDADPNTKHILAFADDGTLAGCARVFPTEAGSRFGRFVVNPAPADRAWAQTSCARASNTPPAGLATSSWRPSRASVSYTHLTLPTKA